MSSSLRITCTALSLIALTGCASITNSKYQPIAVGAYFKGDLVEDVKCELVNDKGTWYVTAPGTVTIQKSYGDLVVTCKKKLMPMGTTTVTSSSNGSVWGNVLAGGVIGYAVDASSGAGFDYPTNINVDLGKTVVVAPPPSQPAHKKMND